jgi:PAS domain S-box-containing protein
MPVTYHLPLVVVSILIAMGASYTALDLAGRVAIARRGFRHLWLGGGAFALGVGMWSMHYVGMLAFRMRVPILYDVPTVGLSLLAAIAAGLVALLIVSGRDLSWMRAAVGAAVMGAGISVMHYVGMTAMRLEARPAYDWRIVALSVAIAVVVSLVALILAFRLRTESRQFTSRKALAAAVMGIAIAAMHYTGMAAAHWVAEPGMGHALHAVAVTTFGVVGIIAVTCLVFTFGVVLSIVDRQLSAKSRQLKESERRYRLVFQRSLTGHYRSTREGRLLECNDAYARLFGFSSPEEAVACSLDDIYESVDDRAAFLEALGTAGTVQDAERRMRRQDGTLIWILEHATMLPDDAAGMDVIEGSVIDITQRVEAVVALAHAMEASDTANRAKSEFLANMSHEIRTPMNGILGMAEILKRSELTSDQRETIDVIQLSAESLMDIINDILDFSKLEVGRLELDPMEFDVRSLVEDSVRTLAPRAHLKDLELVCDVAAGLPARVIGDPGRIRQVLLNLLGNALKFTEQGEVVVRVDAEASAAGSMMLHLSVRDTGIGIPADKQASIFDAFTQADASTTRRFGGTGLGLTITTHLTGLMNGRVSLDSVAGEGSTFHVRIPLPIAAAPAESVAPVGLADLRGLPVLVVDDNATNRHILESTLNYWGLAPTLVDGGRAAIRTMEHARDEGRPFAIVLLDFQMPDMDGFEVAEAIRDHPDLAGTTIMMLSSVGERGDGQRCRAAGVHAYLTKPVRQSVLLDAVLELGGKALARVTGEFPAPRALSARTAPLVTQHSLREAPRALRVLLAEDNPVNQIVATKMLENRGHSVVCAADGREAVEMSATGGFDLILMDVQMPELDGREATREIRLREQAGAARLPIIAVTASAMEGDRDQCIAAGMDGYLSKPIRYESFIEEVERATSAVLMERAV